MARPAFAAAIATTVAVAVFASACVQSRAAPELRGRDVRLTILHTSDIHSRLLPYSLDANRIDRDFGLTAGCPGGACGSFGGAARIATVLRRERARSGRVLHLDSGDIYQGAPIFNIFAGEAEMRVMSQFGVDAAVVGNHEFDRGVQVLEQTYSEWGRFPFLAANYVYDLPGEPNLSKLAAWVRPYATFNVDGLRVGVIGMGNQSTLNSIYEGGNSLGIRPLKTDDVVRDYVRVLRDSVDVLILLSHMGLDEDEGLAVNEVSGRDENVGLAVAGIDVILGGHLHIVLSPPKIVPQLGPDGLPTNRSTVIVHSGAFAKYVGRLDLVVHVAKPETLRPEDQETKVASFSYELNPVNDSIAADGEMQRLLEPYTLTLNRTVDLTRVFAFCPEAIKRNDPSGGDSALGNLVAASMRARSNVAADFAVTNSLGIRADFDLGPLNIEQMFNVFPFENTIATLFLSGAETQEMLDFVARKSADRGCRSQAQVSGLWFDLVCRDPDREPHAENVFVGDDCAPCRPPQSSGYRPGACGCAPLNPFASYRVAVNDYIAAGGSGFIVLKRNTTKFNTGTSLRDALVEHINTRVRRCDPQNDPGTSASLACIDAVSAPRDGRINVVIR